MPLSTMKSPYMPKWMPYQLGMWFHEHIKTSCAVCGLVCRYENSVRLSFAGTKPKMTRQHGLLCRVCHESILWRPSPTALELRQVSKHSSALLAINPAILPNNITSTAPPQHPHLFEPNALNTNTSSIINIQVYCASFYAGIIKRALVAFKYRQQLSALPILVHAIRQLPKPKGCHIKNSLILPTPTTNRRLRTRGFDPVTVLSYYLSRHWQISIWNGVIRIKDHQNQQGLNRQQRKTNVDDAFMLSYPPPANYRHLILFDDVFTTGATMQSFAGAVHNVSHHTQLVAYTIARTHG